MRAEGDLDDLTERVLGAVFEVSNTLGAGFLEKVYERALRKELALRGIRAVAQAGQRAYGAMPQLPAGIRPTGLSTGELPETQSRVEADCSWVVPSAFLCVHLWLMRLGSSWL
ncbi:MAG TPA: GxxExxY protein [Bryobacteraceae bacterium]|jgi:hypothetical protein|nr:GxxExxY protein [Bryobacteraceae bacterium]